MTFSNPHIRGLRFSGSDIHGRYQWEKSATSWKEISNFSGPLASNKPKLYVFSDGTWPYYVGMTRQSLSARLRLGFRAMAKKHSSGYAGYAFKEEGRERASVLHVWIEEDPAPDPEKPGAYCPKNVETIEAELVYLIRNAGDWPKYQTEIHFSRASDHQLQLAQQILDHFPADGSCAIPLLPEPN